MKSAPSILAAPTLCLLLLGGMALEKRAHTKPEDALPFHARAKVAIEAWPVSIAGGWTSRETKIPDAAIQLLHPNAIFSRHYENTTTARQSADLLIVQCRDPIDMSGHYPPNCYPNNGDRLVYKQPRTWQVGKVTVVGMEYHFVESGGLGQPMTKCVYNFFVLPGRGIVPDMDQVREASGDYQRRFFGAAQFQLLFPGEMPQETRDQIFTTIIGANSAALAVLNPGKI